ncbi:MAG: hypothetical protein JW820_15340 [Spirochaetales bacterium]|nr:hypothetical protein [Spirochaetales bacterium]
MVRWTDLPRGFDYYRVEGGITTWDGSPVRPGYYVPIDDHVVGGSTNALERGWTLRHFHTPERIYGAVM